MRRGGRWLVVLLVLAGAGWLVWTYAIKAPTAPQSANGGRAGGGGGGRGARGGGANGEGGPTAVLTAQAKLADVPVTLEAVGTALALNTVTVRSQVDGRLMALDFKEGQDVKKGDLVARIDPTIYQAQYDQAVAKKAQDAANLANARIDLDRYVNLAKTNYGSKQQADTQRASVAQLEAQVQADQGAMDNAKAYLDYTAIRSPLDGRTGIRLVDQGNIVHASDTTGLVVITQLRPITVQFNLPQQNLRAVNAASAAGPLAAVALESDNRTILDSGKLEVVDNQVDQTTGTVKLKATFPNDHLQLWPGSFVNVRLTVDTLKGVVTVPTAAVQRGPNGPFVYGLQDGKAQLIAVTVTRQTETVSVIASGLKPPQAVITTGFARLTDGDRVRVSDRPDVAEGTTAEGAVAGGDAAAASEGPRAAPADGQADNPPPRERRRRSDGGRTDGTGVAGANEAATAPGVNGDPAGMGLRTGGGAASPTAGGTGTGGTGDDPDRAARRRRREGGRAGDGRPADGNAAPATTGGAASPAGAATTP